MTVLQRHSPNQLRVLLLIDLATVSSQKVLVAATSRRVMMRRRVRSVKRTAAPFDLTTSKIQNKKPKNKSNFVQKNDRYGENVTWFGSPATPHLSIGNDHCSRTAHASWTLHAQRTAATRAVPRTKKTPGLFVYRACRREFSDKFLSTVHAS